MAKTCLLDDFQNNTMIFKDGEMPKMYDLPWQDIHPHLKDQNQCCE